MFEATITPFALSILLQSTVLISGGLLAARWCGDRKPVVQSAILRVTLAAVLLCPLASLTLGKLGVGGFGLLPAWDSRDETVPPTELSVREGGPAIESVANQSHFASLTPVASNEALADVPSDAMADVLTAGPRVNPLPGVALAAVPNVNETTAVPVPATATVSNWPLLVNSLVAWCWIAGATLLVIRIVCANIVVARLRRSSSAAAPEIVELCRATAQTLGLSAPRVRVSSGVHSPCLIGVRKPVILLPDQRPFTPQTLRDVLLHELAHLSRRDCAFHLLSRIATALLFFQPLVWVLSRRLEQIADDVCDDHVVQFGTDRKRYAHALVDVADNVRPQWAVASAGVGVFSLKSSLSRRVQRILDSSRSLTLRLHVGGIVLIVLLGLSATAAAAFAFSGNSESTGQSETPEATAPSEGEGAEADTPTPESVPSSQAPRRSTARPVIAAQPTGAEVTRDPFRFEGRVLDPDGQPVPGAKISLFRWQSPGDSTIATTDDHGEFDFEVAPDDELHARIAEDSGLLIATADGFGLAFKSLHECETTGALVAAFQRRSGSQRVAPTADDPVFQLVPDDLPVSGRVVDIEGRPVAGASVRVSKVVTTGAEGLTAWENAAQQPNADYYSLQRYAGGMLGGDVGGSTLDCIPAAVTDDNGEFILPGVGRDRIVKLLISGPGIETNEVHVRTRNGDDIEITKEPRNPGLGMILYHPANFLHVAGPSQAVEGVVHDAKSGQPLAGVTIQSHQLAGRRMAGWTEGIVRAVTDAEGRYRLEGLPLGENRVLALSSIDEPYLVAVFAARTNPGDDSLALDIELTRGIWIHGRAYDVSTSEPIRSGRLGYYAFTDNPHAQAVTGFNGAALSTRYRLSPDGTYRIPGLPGRGIVAVMADRDHEKYRRGQGSDVIEGKEPNLNGFRTYPTLLSAFNYHVLTEVNPTEEQADVEVDLLFDSGSTLAVRVVDEEGNPVTSGMYTGMMEFNSWRPMNSDRIEVYGYQPDETRRLQVIHRERKLAGFLLVTGEDPGDLTIMLTPWAEIRGRLLDSAGLPKANAELSDAYGLVSDNAEIAVLPPGETWQVAKTFTDDDGRFSFAGLVSNREYTLFATERRKDGIGYSLGEIPLDFILEPGEVRDLGDVRLQERGQ